MHLELITNFIPNYIICCSVKLSGTWAPEAEMRGSLMEPPSPFNQPALLDVASSPGKAYNPWSDHTTVFCPRRHEGRLLDQCFGEGSLKGQQSRGNPLLSFSFRRPQGKLLKEACSNDGRAEDGCVSPWGHRQRRTASRGFPGCGKSNKREKRKRNFSLTEVVIILGFLLCAIMASPNRYKR